MEVVNFYIDETKFIKDDLEYLALSLVLVRDKANIEHIQEKLELLKRRLIGDQFLSHDEDDRLFHFTEDSMEIQPKLIEEIRDFSIKGYIAYYPLSEDSMKETYLKILYKLLKDRVSKNITYNMHLYYEENSSIKHPYIQGVLDNILSIHTEANIVASKTTKENILICLPDYLLGVFRDIADTSKKKQDYMYRNYEKFRSKIRLIIDMKNDIFYDKNKPYNKL